MNRLIQQFPSLLYMYLYAVPCRGRRGNAGTYMSVRLLNTYRRLDHAATCRFRVYVISHATPTEVSQTTLTDRAPYIGYRNTTTHVV